MCLATQIIIPNLPEKIKPFFQKNSIFLKKLVCTPLRQNKNGGKTEKTGPPGKPTPRPAGTPNGPAHAESGRTVPVKIAAKFSTRAVNGGRGVEIVIYYIG